MAANQTLDIVLVVFSGVGATLVAAVINWACGRRNLRASQKLERRQAPIAHIPPKSVMRRYYNEPLLSRRTVATRFYQGLTVRWPVTVRSMDQDGEHLRVVGLSADGVQITVRVRLIDYPGLHLFYDSDPMDFHGEIGDVNKLGVVLKDAALHFTIRDDLHQLVADRSNDRDSLAPAGPPFLHATRKSRPDQ